MYMKLTLRHAIVAVCSAFAAQAALAGTITGSAHDFQALGWSGGQICVACHAPHNNLNAATTLLWNHTLTAATYTLYSSPTMNTTMPQPGSASKMCLSCHDGTVALDSYGGRVPTAGAITGAANFGTDLSNDHPIGITYDAALVTSDGGLKAITTSATIGSGAQTRTGTIDTNLLYAGKVECSSCHDVHNTYTDGARLAKISITGSSLCLTCHSK
jgi:predicted CXXCH cytochrome family protein